MTDSVRTWIPRPAWWVPVWVTLDTAGESTDVLETAVVGLVRAGIRAPAAIARELCLDVGLVESAVATLLGAGVLTTSDAGLAAAAAPVPIDGPRGRPGFVVWDPTARRPLLQLWLDRDPPPEAPEAPKGWRLAPWVEPEAYPKRPGDWEVAELLRLLPNAGDLRLYEPRGDGVHASDGARVRRVRRRSGPSLRGPVWAPVEHRVAGAVVWRPSLRPFREVVTELDPFGYEGLERALSGDAQAALEDADRERRDRIAPGVLRQAGFSSVADLRAAARADAARELGDLADAPGWAPVVRLVEDAIVDEHVCLAVGGDWRRPLRGWGDVLESLTGLVTKPLLPLLERLEPRRVDPDERLRLRTLLGRSTDVALAAARTPAEFTRLRDSLRRDMDSIGTRVLALAVCAVLHPPTRRAFDALALDAPGLFDTLDKAKEERNAVVHPKAQTDPIGVAGHRARVLLLCRVLPRLHVAVGSG